MSMETKKLDYVDISVLYFMLKTDGVDVKSISSLEEARCIDDQLEAEDILRYYETGDEQGKIEVR